MRFMGFRFVWTSSLSALLALGASCAAPAPAKSVAHVVATTELGRYLPLENNTVFSYETYIEDTNERGIAVFEISRPRPDLAELSVAGQVRKRYYLEPGAVRSAQGGYLLKSPLAANAEWQGDDGRVRVTAVNQDVAVPAGKFSGCVQTVEEAKMPAASRTTTTMFCPGVGITTLQIEAEQAGTSVLQRLTLKSFGPRFSGL
jgi:hypothetical protein